MESSGYMRYSKESKEPWLKLRGRIILSASGINFACDICFET